MFNCMRRKIAFTCVIYQSLWCKYSRWLVSRYQHDATKHRNGKRCTPSAFVNCLQHTTDKNLALFTVLSGVQHNAWRMAGAQQIIVDLLIEQGKNNRSPGTSKQCTTSFDLRKYHLEFWKENNLESWNYWEIFCQESENFKRRELKSDCNLDGTYKVILAPWKKKKWKGR